MKLTKLLSCLPEDRALWPAQTLTNEIVEETHPSLIRFLRYFHPWQIPDQDPARIENGKRTLAAARDKALEVSVSLSTGPSFKRAAYAVVYQAFGLSDSTLVTVARISLLIFAVLIPPLGFYLHAQGRASEAQFREIANGFRIAAKKIRTIEFLGTKHSNIFMFVPDKLPHWSEETTVSEDAFKMFICQAMTLIEVDRQSLTRQRDQALRISQKPGRSERQREECMQWLREAEERLAAPEHAQRDPISFRGEYPLPER